MPTPQALRVHLAPALDWQDAHVGFDRAFADMPPGRRGVRAPGFDRSCWELLEHMRLAQADILEFCVAPSYTERPWPAAYWPASAEPPDDAAWEASVASLRHDLAALRGLALDESLDLFAPVPNGDGQTYLRELMLVIDHNAYHLGQFVAERKALGCWG
jgi:uncharacterized damage-inducible protein DinB